ncbi:hypothetical protein [Rhizorhabdus wittichii]
MHGLWWRRRKLLEGKLQRDRELLGKIAPHAAQLGRLRACRQMEADRSAPPAHIERQLVERRALKGRVPDLDDTGVGQRAVGIAHLEEDVGVGAGLTAPGDRDRRDVAHEHRGLVDLAVDRGDDVGGAGHPLRVRSQARPLGFLDLGREQRDRGVERIADHIARHARFKIALPGPENRLFHAHCPLRLPAASLRHIIERRQICFCDNCNYHMSALG